MSLIKMQTNSVNTAVNVLGPAMILVMGGFVLLIVLAVLMPIIEINQLVR